MAKESEIKAFLESEDGKRNAERFIKALKERRLVCSVKHVSKSGMSRVISFCEMNSCTEGRNHRKRRYDILQFNWFFGRLGWSYDDDWYAIRVGGCGMDMVFHVLYEVASQLKYYGFNVPKDWSRLADDYHLI